MDKKLWHKKISDVKKKFLVDIESLRTTFPVSCDLSKCGGKCCKDGVGIDVREMDVILANKLLFIPYMKKNKQDPSLWFECPGEDDDYPSGRYIDTRVMEGNCIFHDDTHGCAMEAAAMKLGLHRWTYKPLYCLLYPLVYEDGMLKLDTWHTDLWCHVTKKESAIIHTCRNELTYVFGEAFYRKLLKKINSSGSK